MFVLTVGRRGIALTGWFCHYRRHDGNDKTFPVQSLKLFQTTPSLTLKGRWLEDLGFNTGQPVIVTVERGR
ncbi:SymE family type I addiction module toxin, partial [Dickeya dadantii]|uniref:SymE family type I addiction module toxin n=1 Tax=Dickeya dadantii TaxID=204038 RepID=UPI0011159944